MDILCLAASPRKGGNSDLLLDAFISGVVIAGMRAEKVYISDLKISPCTGCGGCRKSGECVIKDDMTRLYGSFITASSLVIATPVYFRGPTAQLKAVIDRCQALWAKRHILNDLELRMRPGFIICTAAQRDEKTFDCTKHIVRSLFATLGLTAGAELCYSGLEEKGAVARDKKALDEAFALGRGIKEWLE